MNVHERFSNVFDELDLLVLEAERLRTRGPTFRIYHRFSVGTFCSPGEEAVSITLVHRSREFAVRLTTAPILVFDYLSRQRMPQSGTQVARGMAADEFTRQHARSAPTARPRRWRVTRFAVKMNVSRIRRALEETFREAGLDLDPTAVLVSESVSNQALYRLRAQIEWVHLP